MTHTRPGQSAMFAATLAPVADVELEAAVEDALEPAAPATMNREAWLAAAVDIMRPMFAAVGAELPADIAVSVGWPGGKSVRKVIGQCWAASTADGTPHVYISPTLAEPVEVLGCLVHELIHAWDDCKSGHAGAYLRTFRAIGMTGKATQCEVGAPLAERLKVVADTIGPYPHKRVTLGESAVKTQTTRMLKVTCDADGYTVRMTRKWLDELGAPTCPCGERMLEDA